MKARQAKLESLELGEVAIRQKRIMTADLSHVSRLLEPISGKTVYGIIGQDVLKEHRAVIDVDNSLLYLVRDDRDPAPVPPETCSSAPAEGGNQENGGGNEVAK